MLIVVASAVFSWILAREGVPQSLAAATLSLTREPWLVLLLVNLLLLLLGTIMEPLPIMVLVVPMLMPLVRSLGIDPVHFGVVVTLNLMIGLLTPPIGLVMFTMMDIAKVSMERFVRESVPFLLALLLALLLVTYVPGIVLLLPGLAFAR
jgi:tripartite ATP-independent transporter DctM subunit